MTHLPSGLNCSDPRAQRVVTLFEQLQPSDLAQLGRTYATDARFKDPFNDVHSLPAIVGIFEHMFLSLQQPRFTVLTAICEGDQCFLSWDFNFSSGGRAMSIHGSSHLRFDAAGLVCLHRDYWDAAEELYEKLPLLGSLMRWLKRHASR
jgi:steroid delta-isomerase